MEGTNTRSGDGRRLVLGFDAGCMTCSGLARSIEEAVGDKLEVRDLRDPAVSRWIERSLGQEAQWAPTLVEVSGDKVRAWTGPRLGLALSRRLGVRDTWRIIKALGANEEPETASVPTERGFNRTQFLKGLGGAALAMSVLSGTDVFVRIANATEWVHPLNRKKVISSKQLEGEVLQKAVARAAASRDVENIWTEGSPAPDQVMGARYTYRDGNTVTLISWIVGSQLLLYYLPARAIGNYRSQAMRIEVIPEEAYVLEATSVNGKLQPLESAEAPGLARSTRGCRRCKRWKWGCVAIWANGCGACARGSCVPCAAGSLGACVFCIGCLLIACGYGASQCCRRWA